jgi:2-iminobutanoate/2-iminopropanoate deaminase
LKEAIRTSSAPAPKGPYSQAVTTAGRMLYISGQGPVEADSGEFVTDSFEQQARLTLSNLKTLADAGGGSLSQAVKVHVYLRNMDDFAVLNEIYGEFFPEPQPARTTVQSDLPGFDIEVDAVIALDAGR